MLTRLTAITSAMLAIHSCCSLSTSTLLTRVKNSSSVLASCHSVCGSQRSRTRTSKLRFRIVGGELSRRSIPWLAFLLVQEQGRCAGALISRRHVLTAAHCVCTHFDCSHVNEDEVVVNMKEGDLLVFLGIRDLKLVLDPLKRGSLPHGHTTVSEAVVHGKYNDVLFDVALLHLSKAATLGVNIVPVCLPFGPDFPDLRADAHVAGWGNLRNMECHTSMDGLVPNTKCSLPFVYENVVYHTCVFNKPNPSANESMCVKVSKHFPDVLVTTHDHVDLVDNGKVVKSCFAPISGPHGWCVTCDMGDSEKKDSEKKDSEEKPNLCTTLDPLDPVSIADPEHHWGFCTSHCQHPTTLLTNTLHTVTLTILRPQTCSHLLRVTKSPFDEQTELCAGHFYTRKIRQFALVNHTEPVEVDRLKELKLLGGKDACSGDSGAPLFINMGKRRRRVFAVGIVSRGFNCANNNLPGIYVRIKRIKEWIDKNMHDGQCT